MKLLGHVYVATKAFPELDQELLAFGALLPETVFYTKEKALTYDQIHEGGLELYKYCTNINQKYARFKDLAIGTLTHSVKYGADSFNSLDSLVALGYEESDVPKITEALGLDLKIAKARAHNLYDLALDYYINSTTPDILQLVKNTNSIDFIKISNLLGKCYKVDSNKVHNSISHLWDKYDLTLVESFEGLAQLWKSLASDLKERDPVDIAATAKLLEYFYTKSKVGANEFLEDVVSFTKNSVAKAIQT